MDHLSLRGRCKRMNEISGQIIPNSSISKISLLESTKRSQDIKDCLSRKSIPSGHKKPRYSIEKFLEAKKTIELKRTSENHEPKDSLSDENFQTNREILENLKKSYLEKNENPINGIAKPHENKRNNNKKRNVKFGMNQNEPLRKCRSLENSCPKKVESNFNSVPSTQKDYKVVERKVEDGKITFDELMTRVLKNIQRKEDPQRNSTADQKFHKKSEKTGCSADDYTIPNERSDEKATISADIGKVKFISERHNSEVLDTSAKRFYADPHNDQSFANIHLNSCERNISLNSTNTISDVTKIINHYKENSVRKKSKNEGLQGKSKVLESNTSNPFRLSSLISTNCSNNFHKDKSNDCETDSEKSIDFAIYLTSENNVESKSDTENIGEQISVSSGGNVSKIFPNSMENSSSLTESQFTSRDRTNPTESYNYSEHLVSKRIESRQDYSLEKVLGKKISSTNVSNESFLNKVTSVEHSTFLNNILNENSGKTHSGCITERIPLRTIQSNIISNNNPKACPELEIKPTMPTSKCGNNLLDDELGDILRKIKQQKSGNTETSLRNGNKCSLKRYRKRKSKMFRSKKQKKIRDKTIQKYESENVDTIFKKMTQNFIGHSEPFSRSKSTSSISTTSSYITDDTRSDTLSTGSKELPVPQQKSGLFQRLNIKTKTVENNGNPSFANIHPNCTNTIPEVTTIINNSNNFHKDKSNDCETDSEKSIDFAIYLTSENNVGSKSVTENIGEQINVSSEGNVSKLFPNSMENSFSLTELQFTSKDRTNPTESYNYSEHLVSQRIESRQNYGLEKVNEKKISSTNVPTQTFLNEVTSVEHSMFLNEILNENSGITHEGFITSRTIEGTQRTPLRTIQSNIISNNPKVCPTSETVATSKCGSSLLDDDMVRTILTDNYEKCRRRKELKVDENCNELGDIFRKIKQQKSGKAETSLRDGNKCCFKIYRKGKLNIFRLKKLKKICDTTIRKTESENLNFDVLMKKMTQDFIGHTEPLSRSKSTSSISTTSSYITDDTRSDTSSTGSKELPVPQQKLRKGLNDISKDQSLYCDEEQRFHTEYDKNEIKMNIQNIFLQVFDDLTNGRKAFLKLRRQNFGNCTFKEGRLQFKPEDELAMSVINSSAQRSQARFKLILYILKKIQTLLETNTRLTKRELYYQLKSLIGDQRVTDRAINSISCLLDVGMWALNIVAQKGLVFGDLKILLASGETVNCNVPGTMIPQDVGEIIEIQSSAYFILVVEKESIFHKLIEEDLPNKLTRPFIMITGKGFPDLNTQLFLKKLWVVMTIPIFILVDADPHGINIMLNYKFGSVNNAHVSHHLAVSKAKWLGVLPSEIGNLNITKQSLNERELKLAENLLKMPYMAENPRIANELKILIEKKCKAGIEGLIKNQQHKVASYSLKKGNKWWCANQLKVV
ncbi:hypothetical protein JTB14_037240 [Gonioctena quinquepunctata]|nr:hypothetical protein JTB14_037240 [Gonioctena quinquepunctata]